MIERVRFEDRAAGGGNYFAAPKKDIDFISSGCKVLDLALGGGWAEGRVSNIVGDKSSGKTLLCIEAAANFVQKYQKGKVRYREAEAAFDEGYADALGMPMSHVDFGKELETIEDLFEDLEAVCDKAKQPELYIVDSLDALTDRSEMAREIDDPTYGAEKAKKLSQLFRRLTRQIAGARVTLIVVSQVRSKIGRTLGRATTRSGGKALDFYASQVLYLAQTGQVFRTVSGIKRPVAIKVHAKVDKNKVALPFREADMQIHFGFGVDDTLASLQFLREAKALKSLSIKIATEKEIRALAMDLRDEADRDLEQEIAELVEKRWFEIETGFLPTRKKYNRHESGQR